MLGRDQSITFLILIYCMQCITTLYLFVYYYVDKMCTPENNAYNIILYFAYFQIAMYIIL